MRGFAPCFVVIFAGLALGVAGGFAWITGDAYTPEHPQAFTGPALITVPEPSLKSVSVNFPTDSLPRATRGTLSRGGEAS